MIVNFTGDISITGTFVKCIERGEDIFSKKIQQSLSQSNFTICNLEGPTTSLTTSSSIQTKIKSPTNTIKYLSSRNINIYNLANNHTLDCNTQGLIDTINLITQNQSNYFGAGINIEEASKPLIIQKDTIKIGLIGISDSNFKIKGEEGVVFSSKETSILNKRINDLKSKVDYVIINFHGGEEYTNYPSPTKRRYLKKIASIKGVDIIICHHSHTLQTYEKYKGKYIFYSLGNFIFDIPQHNSYKYTKESALLKFEFEKSGFSFKFIPYKIEGSQICNVEVEEFEKYFKSISSFKGYTKKWMKESYRILYRKNNIKNSDDFSTNFSGSLQNKSFLHLLFSRKFYKKSFEMLRSDNYRAIYLGAFIYKLYQLFKLNKNKWLK